MNCLSKLLCSAVLAGTLAAWPAVAIELRGAGSTLVEPLVTAWSAARAPTGLRIAYSAVGSGKGIQAFSAGEVDFGATERPMRDAEIATVREGVIHVPVTAGMVVVAYNIPGHRGELRFARQTLAGIFSGRITRWDAPAILADNPGVRLPGRDIALIVRRDASGTSFAFSNHLAAIDQAFGQTGPGASQLPAWPRHAITAYGNEGVASRIAIAEYSIGYVEYGFADRLGLAVATLQNAAGAFVRPTSASGGAALAAAADAMPMDGRQTIPDPLGTASYPIVTYAWFLLREHQPDQGKSAALRDFVRWGLRDGQQVAESIGYVPLPGQVAERAAALIDGRR